MGYLPHGAVCVSIIILSSVQIFQNVGATVQKLVSVAIWRLGICALLV